MKLLKDLVVGEGVYFKDEYNDIKEMSLGIVNCTEISKYEFQTESQRSVRITFASYIQDLINNGNVKLTLVSYSYTTGYFKNDNETESVFILFPRLIFKYGG